MRFFDTGQDVHFEPGPFFIAFTLVGLGSFLAFLGLVIGGMHSLRQGINWAQDAEHRQLAKAKWSQVKTAGTASANAWKDAAPADGSDKSTATAPDWSK